MRVMRTTFLAAALGMAFAGAGEAQTTLRIGLAEDPDALDPTLARTFVGRIVFASLCDKLLDIGPNLEIVPQLATAWKWADDQKALTMTLRQGVRFQDGEPMDAAAVKYSIERHLTFPGSNRKGELAAVASVDVIDDHTVRLNLKTPFAPLLAQLTDRAGMIVSPKAAQALGDKFSTHPVCAGPYKLTERVAQDRIVLDRFDGYWDKDKIKIDRIQFQPIPDTSVRLANLRAGSLDFIERVEATDYAQLKSNPAFKTTDIIEIGYQGITINTNNGPGSKTPLGQDARVRDALDLAIDREALVQVASEGLYVPGNQWVPPNNPYYAKDFPVRKRDVAKARALLKEAGLAKVTVDFMVPNDSDAQRQGQIIQAMAAEAGIDLQIHATEFARALDLAEQGEFGAFFLAWSGRSDPDGNIYNFVACKGPLNDGKLCDPGLDAALDASRQNADPAARRKAYRDVAEKVLAEHPILYLYHRRWLWAYATKVQGFSPYPDGLIRPQGLTVK